MSGNNLIGCVSSDANTDVLTSELTITAINTCFRNLERHLRELGKLGSLQPVVSRMEVDSQECRRDGQAASDAGAGTLSVALGFQVSEWGATCAASVS